MDQSAESKLVQSARAGDVSAFEALYRAYNERIYNFARRMTGSAEDARDVTQETFIRAWDALPRLRAAETFTVWLHRIAHNVSQDALKRRAHKQCISLDDCGPDDDEPMRRQIASDTPAPEEHLVAAETQNAVRLAIDSLSDEHRVVVAMHHIEGMDVETIAGVLGVPKGTVMSRLSRARETLRRKLSPYVEVGYHDTKL